MTLEMPGLPETGWQVASGLYNLEDGLRLPVYDQQRRVLPDDKVLASPDIH